MTEYEKMAAGKLYYAGDPELREMRKKVRILLDKINSSVSEIKQGNRYELGTELFGRVGENLFLQPPFYCDYGVHIELGDNVFFNFGCVLLDVAKIRIGSNVLFAPNVQVYTAAHPLDVSLRQAEQEFGKPITIGDNVWIGGGAVICPGVTIGESSVVGAGAVVTKDVEPSSVVAGNPARVIKRI
ncbi:sugar O-acetyltransferase [Sedimentisphaera salicampi]|uniref:sugar O-acetyltransferase n=1 Tax=Sedimentisphaera salicampi TaxID=1941349 RepID=UPI000B9D3A9D|nr:sugar O-acetyltransferase [Sedimentisphaera salicampi]OXU14616.1 Maltose O-acetyltransferase [Sedimentisphaera salicampi]